MIQTLQTLFSSGEATLALVKNDEIVFTVYGRGSAPALELYDLHPALLEGADVYDLIVGKAAASLFLLGGANSVYGFTMSRKARDLLQSCGVRCGFETLTDDIFNRDGTGLCPFEQAVAPFDTPADCLPAIRRTLSLRRARK